MRYNVFATVMRGLLLAAMAMLVLIVPGATVDASPRQQTVVDICNRTQVVQDAILAALTGSPTCATVTDTQLASITRLEFFFYPNSSIPPADFAGLTGLTFLSSIFSDALTTVPDDAFTDLTALEYLSISSNSKLTTLGADAFDGLTNLELLELEFNGLTTLDENIFDGLDSLEDLRLNGNSLTALDEDIFDGLTNLTDLNLYGNDLTTLDEDIFDGLDDLEDLQLFGNDLTELDADIFDGLTNLDILDLSDNLLTTLDADIFDGTALVDLRISSNSLTTLDGDIFDGLDDLEDLRLNDNSLTALPGDIFEGITALEDLDLSCNYFTTLDLDIFDPFAATLLSLDLQSDSFTTALSETAINAKFTDPNFFLSAGTRECARVTASPTSLRVAEGSTGMYSVALRSQPTGDVTVDVTSDNSDVTVSPTSLTFSTSNWNTAQTVTVSAAQDTDGADESATLTLDPSGGADYADVVSTALPVMVTDDDIVGLTVTPTSLMVDEGDTNTYTVKLLTQPATTVTVTVSSDDTGAATVNRSTLRFTTSNWDMEQTVTVRGVNDDDSTDETVTITHTASGGEYETVTVTVVDNDTPGITFTPAARTIREGATGTYDVKLNTAPTADVTVVISSDIPDVTVNKSSLTFTTANYATNQPVTVTAGQDADAADDTAHLTHRPSGGGYSAGEDKDFMVTVTDDDTAGLMLSATTLDVDEGGQNTYTVKLQTQPTTTVTVTASSGDTGAATVIGSTLIFTASNWETEQTVTVEGVDDGDLANETVTVTNTASGGEYEGVTASVRVTVDDNDKPGITFTPASLTVGEGGGDTYNVKLNTAPTADVTVAIRSDNPDVTVMPNSLTFTSLNFAANQQVTVTTGQDADAADDTANLTHRPSGGGYGSGQNKDLIVTVTDDDTAALVLSSPTLEVDEGGQNTYTVKLQTQPTTTVTVTVSSDDPDAATVSGSTIRFTTSNWNTARTVTVRGVNDNDSTDEIVTMTNTASGGEYAGVTETVTVTVDDDDTPGITFTPAGRTIREGATGTYDVKLNTAPTADVTVAISSDNPDVTVNKSSLTFTTANYARNQRVTVTAGQDADAADGTANLTHRPSGGDYGAGEAKDFMVTVTDDDTAGLVLSATTLGVDEAGQNTYTVKLKTPPTTTVTVTVSSGNTGAATVSGSTLIFTASNWDTARTVTVRGVNDVDLLNEVVMVTNTASGGEYEGVTASVRVTVDDDDKPGITFTPASLTVGEGGGSTYDVKLNTAPTAVVTVAISSSNPDVKVMPNSLTFTSLNFAGMQPVTVTADLDADAADDTANLTHRPSGGGYGTSQNKDLIVTVTDDDTAALVLSSPTLEVDEGGQNTYTVKLQTPPTTTVTVTVSSDDPGAATVSGSTLRFTTSNWDTAQTVTVRGVNDVDLLNEVVMVTNTASGGEYAGVTETVTVTVEDTGMNPPPPPPPPPTGRGGGGFGAAFEAPQFVDGFRTSRPLEENAQPGDPVGDPVAATHPRNSEITYSLSGTDAARFTVDEETGQIRLGQAITLALGQTYTVNLTGTDSGGTGAIIIVDIVVAEAAFHRYDLNKNGSIEKDEVLAAVADYFAARIEKPLVLEVVSLYFAA